MNINDCKLLIKAETHTNYTSFKKNIINFRNIYFLIV